MKSIQSKWYLACSVAILLTLATQQTNSGLHADDVKDGKKREAKEAGSKESLTNLAASATAEFSDPAFDKYIDLALIQNALLRQDPGLLTDAGLQLAKGERILFRSHKIGSADTVLGLALQLARQNYDKETLQRLVKAGESLNLANLKSKASAAVKLAGAARAVDPELEAVLKSASKEQSQAVNSITQRFKSAALIGDHELVKAISELASKSKDLSDTQKAYLEKSGKWALEKASTESDDPKTKALRKLTAKSRALRYSAVGHDEVFWVTLTQNSINGSRYSFNYHGTIIRGNGEFIAYGSGALRATCWSNQARFFGAELTPEGVQMQGNWNAPLGTQMRIPGWRLDHVQGVTLVR